MKTKLALLAVITGISLALPSLRADDAPQPAQPGGDGSQCQQGGGHRHHWKGANGGGKPAPSPSPNSANYSPFNDVVASE